MKTQTSCIIKSSRGARKERTRSKMSFGKSRNLPWGPSCVKVSRDSLVGLLALQESSLGERRCLVRWALACFKLDLPHFPFESTTKGKVRLLSCLFLHTKRRQASHKTPSLSSCNSKHLTKQPLLNFCVSVNLFEVLDLHTQHFGFGISSKSVETLTHLPKLAPWLVTGPIVVNEEVAK